MHLILFFKKESIILIFKKNKGIKHYPLSNVYFYLYILCDILTGYVYQVTLDDLYIRSVSP